MEPPVLQAKRCQVSVVGQVQPSASYKVRMEDVNAREDADVDIREGLIPPAIYYARVVGELGKIVFRGRNMYPP